MGSVSVYGGAKSIKRTNLFASLELIFMYTLTHCLMFDLLCKDPHILVIIPIGDTGPPRIWKIPQC